VSALSTKTLGRIEKTKIKSGMRTIEIKKAFVLTFVMYSHHAIVKIFFIKIEAKMF